MFHTSPEAMAYSLSKSLLMTHRFVDDLKPEEFAAQPIPGCNSIAWIIGHLVNVDRRQLGWLGATELPLLPEWFREEAFKTTRTTAVAQENLGDGRELVELFDAHRKMLIQILPTVDAAKFAEAPSMQSPLFADRGEATLFMGLHTALHMGQISVLRRALGYPPVN